MGGRGRTSLGAAAERPIENDRKLILEFARVQASIGPSSPRGKAVGRTCRHHGNDGTGSDGSRRLAAAVMALACGLYIAWDQATYNFGEVQQARIYRSGQMPASSLARTVRDYRIKTVLNLRGSNKDPWYAAERSATVRGQGATQVDIAMSSCIWMSRPAPDGDRDARHVRVSDADPLPVGGRAHRLDVGVRRVAPAGEHPRRCPRPVLDPLPVRPGQRWQGHGRAPRPVRALARRAGMDA